MSLTDSYPPAHRSRPPPPAPLRIDKANAAFTPRAPPARHLPSSMSNNSGFSHSYSYTPGATNKHHSTSRSPPRSPPPSALPLLSPRTSIGSAHSPPPNMIHMPKPPPRQSPQPRAEDLADFEKQCRDFFYQQSHESGQKMNTILSSLPPSQRARFTRIQASIRAQFHSDRTLAIQSAMLALLSSTIPLHSLTPPSRARPHGKAAQKEREEKLSAFLREWGKTMDTLPGVRKFIEGLYSTLRLMSRPENHGGAGGRRVEWELDDAIFMESAGEEFMRDAIIMLKGVLGFSDTLPTNETNTSVSSLVDIALPPPPVLGRTRSSSDPFTDPSTPPLTTSPDPSMHLNLQSGRPAGAISRGRLWVSPAELTNPSIIHLLALFPVHIKRSAGAPRFQLPTAERKRDVEALATSQGDQPEDEWTALSTGRLRLTSHFRRAGWRGSMMFRFCQWLASLVGS
ncbi:hypothetical protein CALVIDRAFT_534908 [Calocera viscosa TUFC12733]|uniref:Uncharacterized protein n=1 Tax=Calocera viscosa (strain TUFC12733) TaxID=1330018 RepID=A0A167PIL5_CALVF|nr:hypothetical protein CALVIDRAFT_534908 [Calocera viscosa TUFC12733]